MTRRTAPAEDAIQSPRDLTEPEERFIQEYLIDRDPSLAAIRAGVARINLKKTVQKWMTDPNIVREIQRETDSADIEKMISPQRIMAGFIDVAFDKGAPASARNSALKELAEMKSMYKDNEKDRRRSGVMLVPAEPSLDDWRTAAQEQQAKLKDDVRT